MNTATQTKENNMSFVESRNIFTAYKTKETKSGTRIYRNFTRLLFEQEPVGTKLYFIHTPDGFDFSRTPIENAAEREVVAIYNKQIERAQRYINVRDLVEDGEYDIYRLYDGYYKAIQKSSVPQMELQKVDQTSSTRKMNYKYVISIPQHFIRTITGDVMDPVYIVTEQHSPKCFISIKCLERNGTEGIKKLSNRSARDLKLTEDSIITKRKNINGFTINRFFCEFLRITKEDQIYVHLSKDETEIIIEKKDFCCSVCGRPITSEDNVERISMCPKCDTAAKAVRNKIQYSPHHSQDVTMNMMRKELMELNQNIRKILKEY